MKLKTRTAGLTVIVLSALLSQFVRADDDWFKVWHNRDKWEVAGDVILNPDNSRRLVGKAGGGVLINGKEGKCPSLVTKRRDYRDVQFNLRSRGGMGHLESHRFLPKEAAKRMGLRREEAVGVA